MYTVIILSFHTNLNNCHIQTNIQTSKAMQTRQQNARPILTLARGKSNRRFGQDLTNCYNIQTNTNTSLSESTCLSSLLSVKNANQAPQQYKTYAYIQSSSQVDDMIQEVSTNPIEDHYQDIMSYTLDQSFFSCIQEDFLRWHTEINEEMREILINWMMRLHSEFKLQQSTLCLAVHLVDRFCYQQSVLKNKFQLLGVTCLFMAAKYQELATPRLKIFVEACENLYTRNDILEMEGQVLYCVGFNINKIVLLRQLLLNRINEVFKSYCFVSNEMDQERDSIPMDQQLVVARCEYFLELILIEYKLNLVQSHYLSSVLIYVSCKMENIRTVNSKFIIEKYNLSQKMFKDCFQMFIATIKRSNQPKFRQTNIKYQHLRNYQI